MAERIRIVRKVLLEKLNHSRVEHGRRLFTALFEPLLCRDGRFLDPQFTPPGYLHRIDVGGIWHVLSANHFPDLARRLKERLDILTAEIPVDQALESDEGEAMAEDLRRAAVAGLDRVLSSTSSCKDLLHRANIWRQENARRANPATAVRPLMREDLLLMRAILTMPPDVYRMIGNWSNAPTVWIWSIRSWGNALLRSRGNRV